MAGKRDYKKEYREYHAKRAQKIRRAQRNKARRKALRDGKVKKGDHLEVHHPGSHRTGRLPNKTEVTTRSRNRRIQPKRTRTRAVRRRKS